MKITRKQLITIIKEMAFDPEKAGLDVDAILTQKIGYPTDDFDDRRALGLLQPEQAEAEKEILRKWHEENRAEIFKFYNELKKPIEQARITCLHSISYEGFWSDKNPNISVLNWIKQYGKRNRDQISTVLFPNNITDLHKSSGDSNTDGAIDGVSFIMQGFPAIISYGDIMSQTLSAVPQALIDFQRGSGLSKSTNYKPGVTNFEDFIKNNRNSEETVLDNWEIKGVHAGFSSTIHDKTQDDKYGYNERARKKFKQIKSDCINLNLPFYVTYTETDEVNWINTYICKRII